MSTARTGTFGLEITIRLTNRSSEQSNYLISINLLDSSGLKLGEGTAISNHVTPASRPSRRPLLSSAGASPGA